ncbi:MAG: CBM41, partial [uncultured Thermoleophilia bacterium]
HAKVGTGEWTSIGTDDNAPYRVFHDVAALETGTAVQYRAIVLDNAGNTRTSRMRTAEVPAPRISIDTPAQGSRVRGEVRLRASVDPERASQVVTFQRQVGTGAWTTLATDSSSPAYTAVDDISGLGLATGDAIRYRAVLTEADGNEVTSRVRTVQVAPPPATTAVVHYKRPAGDYADWGLHLFGAAVKTPTEWTAPLQPVAIDADGARYEIALKDDAKPVEFIVHLPGGDVVPTSREPGGNRSFLPINHPEIWLKQGDPTVYTSRPADF